MKRQPEHILVVQPLFLGDAILSLPFLRQLKASYPQSKIDILVRKESEEVAANSPVVSSVIVFENGEEGGNLRNIFSLAKLLRSMKFDTAFIFPGSIRAALAVYFSGIRRRIGTNQSTGISLFQDHVKFPSASWDIPNGTLFKYTSRVRKILRKKHSFISLLYTDVVAPDPLRHAIQRYLQLLDPLSPNIDKSIRYEPLYPNVENLNRAKKICLEIIPAGARLIAVAPGSKWNTKRWPAENFIELVRKTIQRKYYVVLVGGDSDAELCEKICSAVGTDQVINTCGRLSVLSSAALIERCDLLLTNDSAAMHIGAAMGRPLVILMGPTVPAFGYVPPEGRHAVLDVENLWCRPCTPFGGITCPTGTFSCMKKISVETVFDTVMNALN